MKLYFSVCILVVILVVLAVFWTSSPTYDDDLMFFYAKKPAVKAPAPASKVTPAKAPASKVTPAKGSKVTPAKGSKVTPAKGSKVTPAKGSKVTPAKASKDAIDKQTALVNELKKAAGKDKTSKAYQNYLDALDKLKGMQGGSGGSAAPPVFSPAGIKELQNRIKDLKPGAELEKAKKQLDELKAIVKLQEKTLTAAEQKDLTEKQAKYATKYGVQTKGMFGFMDLSGQQDAANAAILTQAMMSQSSLSKKQLDSIGLTVNKEVKYGGMIITIGPNGEITGDKCVSKCAQTVPNSTGQLLIDTMLSQTNMMKPGKLYEIPVIGKDGKPVPGKTQVVQVNDNGKGVTPCGPKKGSGGTEFRALNECNAGRPEPITGLALAAIMATVYRGTGSGMPIQSGTVIAPESIPQIVASTIRTYAQRTTNPSWQHFKKTRGQNNDITEAQYNEVLGLPARRNIDVLVEATLRNHPGLGIDQIRQIYGDNLDMTTREFNALRERMRNTNYSPYENISNNARVDAVAYILRDPRNATYMSYVNQRGSGYRLSESEFNALNRSYSNATPQSRQYAAFIQQNPTSTVTEEQFSSVFRYPINTFYDRTEARAAYTKDYGADFVSNADYNRIRDFRKLPAEQQVPSDIPIRRPEPVPSAPPAPPVYEPPAYNPNNFIAPYYEPPAYNPNNFIAPYLPPAQTNPNGNLVEPSAPPIQYQPGAPSFPPRPRPRPPREGDPVLALGKPAANGKYAAPALIKATKDFAATGATYNQYLNAGAILGLTAGQGSGLVSQATYNNMQKPPIIPLKQPGKYAVGPAVDFHNANPTATYADYQQSGKDQGINPSALVTKDVWDMVLNNSGQPQPGFSSGADVPPWQ